MTPIREPQFSTGAEPDLRAALDRCREIALQSRVAPLAMGEIIKRVDIVLGDGTPLPDWIAAAVAGGELISRQDAVKAIYGRSRGICTEGVAHQFAQIIRAIPAVTTEVSAVMIPRYPTESMMDAGLYHLPAHTTWADLHTAWTAMFDTVTLDGGTTEHALTAPDVQMDHIGDLDKMVGEQPARDEVGELLPCPFCGTVPNQIDHSTLFVGCHGCHADGPLCVAGGGEAMQEWNRRAISAARAEVSIAEAAAAWIIVIQSLADSYKAEIDARYPRDAYGDLHRSQGRRYQRDMIDYDAAIRVIEEMRAIAEAGQ